MDGRSAIRRLVPYLVGLLASAVLAVVLAYAWNMHIADGIFTDRCGFTQLGTDPAPTMTWLGCSE